MPSQQRRPSQPSTKKVHQKRRTHQPATPDMPHPHQRPTDTSGVVDSIGKYSRRASPASQTFPLLAMASDTLTPAAQMTSGMLELMADGSNSTFLTPAVRNGTAAQTDEWKTQFFKTKMCPYHAGGRCINGETCRFAHNPVEVRPLPDLQRTKLCESYVREEPCTDSNCPFAHDPSELRTSSHSFYKVTLCNFYKKGRCWNGAHCRFAHGVAELQLAPAPSKQASLKTSTVVESEPDIRLHHIVSLQERASTLNRQGRGDWQDKNNNMSAASLMQQQSADNCNVHHAQGWETQSPLVNADPIFDQYGYPRSQYMYYENSFKQWSLEQQGQQEQQGKQEQQEEQEQQGQHEQQEHQGQQQQQEQTPMLHVMAHQKVPELHHARVVDNQPVVNRSTCAGTQSALLNQHQKTFSMTPEANDTALYQVQLATGNGIAINGIRRITQNPLREANLTGLMNYSPCPVTPAPKNLSPSACTKGHQGKQQVSGNLNSRLSCTNSLNTFSTTNWTCLDPSQGYRQESSYYGNQFGKGSSFTESMALASSSNASEPGQSNGVVVEMLINELLKDLAPSSALNAPKGDPTEVQARIAAVDDITEKVLSDNGESSLESPSQQPRASIATATFPPWSFHSCKADTLTNQHESVKPALASLTAFFDIGENRQRGVTKNVEECVDKDGGPWPLWPEAIESNPDWLGVLPSLSNLLLNSFDAQRSGQAGEKTATLSSDNADKDDVKTKKIGAATVKPSFCASTSDKVECVVENANVIEEDQGSTSTVSTGATTTAAHTPRRPSDTVDLEQSSKKKSDQKDEHMQLSATNLMKALHEINQERAWTACNSPGDNILSEEDSKGTSDSRKEVRRVQLSESATLASGNSGTKIDLASQAKSLVVQGKDKSGDCNQPTVEMSETLLGLRSDTLPSCFSPIGMEALSPYLVTSREMCGADVPPDVWTPNVAQPIGSRRTYTLRSTENEVKEAVFSIASQSALCPNATLPRVY